MDGAKPIWQSKTFWVNLFTVVATVAATVSGVLPPEFQAYIAPIIAIANIGLRFLTDKPVSL